MCTKLKVHGTLPQTGLLAASGGFADLFKDLGVNASEIPKLLRVPDQYFLDNDEWLSDRSNHTKWNLVLDKRMILSNEIANNKWFGKVLQLGEKLRVETAEIGLPALHSLDILLKKKVDEKLGARAKSAKAAAAKNVPEDQEMAAPQAATPKAPAVRARPDAADHKRVIAELDTNIAELGTKSAELGTKSAELGTKAGLLEEEAGRMRLDVAKVELELLAIKKRTAKKELAVLALKEKEAKQELERIAVKEKEAKKELERIAVKEKEAKDDQELIALRLQEQAATGGSGPAASTTAADVKPAAPSADVIPVKGPAVTTTDSAPATTPRRCLSGCVFVRGRQYGGDKDRCVSCATL
ncbi:hypothetical protein FN846DRAFT_986298 [Sphaerosporella brunnea]|uniref:Uncharacterized protein n=1 Tax=Sphaerosporella brunnea TaxID=1250544 RepID=A0A5J5ESW6_9PEZI|nr:hypothetical protein FN846DRAFT_986298 [Sphaerosporella brunnea]